MENIIQNPIMSSSSLTKEEQSFFSFEDVIVMASEDCENGGTREVEPVLYLESLESRVKTALNASKGFYDLVTLAESYEDDSKMNIRLNTTPVRSDEFQTLVEDMAVKEVVTMDTPYGVVRVPIPTTQAIPKYQKVMNTAASASMKTLKDLSCLTSKSGVNMIATAKQIKQICEQVVQKHSKTPERKDILKDILGVMMIERIKERELAKICDHYSKPEMWVDPLTQGIWIVDPTERHPSISAARERKVISVYELDDNLTQNLILLSFSKSPRETATAKLNLFSRVKGVKRSDIKANPRKVLARVFSEAELDQEEIKAMIFTKPREPTPLCPACNTHMEIEGIAYHNECEVVRWLLDNFFFKYDKSLGVLSTQRVVYLDPNQRCLLESIQRSHRTLNSPFKIKGGAKYAVMQRDGEGFKTLTQISTNPATVPGTAEWLDKQRRDEELRKRNHVNFR